MGSTLADVDFIEELRLRRWARENFVVPEERDDSWHPLILEEMRRKDEEAARYAREPLFAASQA